jgi:hypothetical protein
MNKNALNWPNLNRVYQIARLGNFSIRVVYPNDYIAGQEDYQMIKENLKNVEFKKDGELLVSIYKEKARIQTLESECNDFNKFEHDFDKLSKKETPTVFQSKETCEALLKTASNRLNFGLDKTERIYQIAAIIAKVDGKKLIGTEHVAEAIQYNCPSSTEESFYVEAESCNMIFGHGITIATTNHDKWDIENAINYLKSLL